MLLGGRNPVLADIQALSWLQEELISPTAYQVDAARCGSPSRDSFSMLEGCYHAPLPCYPGLD